MHIIIPMSGIGNRFIEAGYKEPKPLVIIDGKAIIEHVCDLFPGENKITFICNSKHLAETNMREVLLKIRPSANIVEISNHKKGPVFAVYLVEHLIDDDEEVIVNYCDFGTYWDYRGFLKHTRERNADGAVPAYKGLHPHMLTSGTNYAFMRDNKQWMLEIKEKQPFTDNRMNEYASNGTYYFKKGSYVKKYFKQLMDLDINLKGEYYVSLVYNLLVEDKLEVSIYEIQHMLQWGTPQDVEEYNKWSKYFNDIINQQEKPRATVNSLTLIPLAGHGSRFAKNGYQLPKPLIPVSGKPMIIQAADSLPNTGHKIFVTLAKHLSTYPLKQVLSSAYPDCKIISIDEVTSGQAVTCGIGLKDVDVDSSLLIAATDNGMIYNQERYQELINDKDVDAIIFTFRHHQSSRTKPEMYGWVETCGLDVLNVSVKVPISQDPYHDHAVVGTFYFKKVEIFKQALEKLLEKNIQVNGEFYIDSLLNQVIALGFKVKIFEVDDYICWGTPEDYETFVYWQSFFHKVLWHRYSLEKDLTVDKSKVKELDTQYRTFSQKYK